MRLTDHEVAAIKAAARDAFGESAVVRLFGRRVDDSFSGGDVDLHVEADATPDAAARRFDFILRLGRTMPWHDKVDVVLSRRGAVPRGFERIAYRDGIIL